MKQDQEERTIRELFRQLRRNDESGAPSFAESLAPAPSRYEKDSRLRPGWQVAVAIVAAIMIGVAWLIFSGQETKTPGSADMTRSHASPAPRDETPPPNPTPSPLGEQTFKTGRRYRKQGRDQLRPETILLSQWRSPTEFLMRTPGDQFLKTIPRLNESLIKINIIATPQQNNQQN